MEKEEITRAELAAEKAYPPLVVKTLYGEFDCNAYARLLFWRGYQLALDEMKKEAVEGEVYLYHSYNRDATAILVDIPKENLGDKVCVVVLKEEEE